MRKTVRVGAIVSTAIGALMLATGVAHADVYGGYFWVDAAGGGNGAALVQCNSVGNAMVHQNDPQDRYSAWHCDEQWNGGYRLWLEETVYRTPSVPKQ